MRSLPAHLSDQLQISDKYARSLIRENGKIWGEDIVTLSKTLQEKGIYFYKWPLTKEGIPQVSVIITSEMKQLYREFGSVIKIDFTYGLIRDSAT